MLGIFNFESDSSILINNKMSILRWLMEDKNEQPPPKFITKIDVNPKSTLYVEVEPKDPTNCSNISLTAFASKQVRTIVPIRV